MEWLGYLGAFVLGAGAAFGGVWTGYRLRTRGAEESERSFEASDRMRIQYENFFGYDGTDRGQKEIGD